MNCLSARMEEGRHVIRSKEEWCVSAKNGISGVWSAPPEARARLKAAFVCLRAEWICRYEWKQPFDA